MLLLFFVASLFQITPAPILGPPKPHDAAGVQHEVDNGEIKVVITLHDGTRITKLGLVDTNKEFMQSNKDINELIARRILHKFPNDHPLLLVGLVNKKDSFGEWIPDASRILVEYYSVEGNLMVRRRGNIKADVRRESNRQDWEFFCTVNWDNDAFVHTSAALPSE